MSPFSPIPPRHPIRVVLSSTALLPFVSVRKAAALAIAQLGVAAFFLSGVARDALGDSAIWFVLLATVLAGFVRAIDIEGWALLMPGGFVSRVTAAFGPATAGLAKAAALVERLLLGALASVVIGHYLANVSATAIAGLRFTGFVRSEDLATSIAAGVLGLLWLRIRIGRDLTPDRMSRAVWIGVAIVVAAIVWGGLSLLRTGLGAIPGSIRLPSRAIGAWSALDAVMAFMLGFAVTLPAIGGGEALARAATDLPPPRVQALRRVGLLTFLFGLIGTALGTFLTVALVPAADQSTWVNAPLVGLAQHLAGPAVLRDVMAIAVTIAAVFMLMPAAHAALGDTERMVHRAAADGTLPSAFASLHSRFGTPTRAIDVTVAAMILVILASGGRITWLAHAYAIAIAVTIALTVAALARLRRTRTGPAPFSARGNLRFKGREVPIGLLASGLIVVASTAATMLTGDAASVAAGALIAIAALWFTAAGRFTTPVERAPDDGTFDLLLSAELALDQVEARPGNVLVPVRNPHLLAHVVAALHTPRDRDVVIMTARMIGADVSEESAGQAEPTTYERRLLSDVVALAERVGRPVHLLIVPTRNVLDAIVGTVVRLRSSDVFVGESSTLSSADQARLLGEAWERADKPEALDVRLVVHHRSGRADTYHLGAHPPSLTSGDLDLIHRLWLDAVKAVGPHVHHDDVVRAALKQMEQQLTGPQREEAVAAIRDEARPAEELAEVLRARDYARLRDMLRNRHASEVAALLTALGVEDQAVIFRVMPRKDAAAVFEYLETDSKETLLKAMAQEDVAKLLNDMAPDDRTLFLEELPAEATRHLLALLTPAERAVALTLLGYPEQSVGRLMTHHYVAVRDHWTVRDVLDYVRTHGQDSETLNVIYVVDDQGSLIDDIRIRELLLAPLDKRITEIMDRRFVALKATDDQAAAVGMFRQYDRTALPVTDTAGMLIGIVTIDDVLDVAEATATREIQRIGGSEALDEPYISIAFWKMIQKRAGWLTALFIGEMLTATAMGAFEEEISKAVVLALFVPLIISSGGNSGSQAATLVIRALALGEVGVRDWWRVMRREVFAGMALGAILGSIGFLRISLWSAFSDIYGPHWLLVAITVSVALMGVVLWGTLSGSLLPFLLKRLGFDPAASSAPFVATLVDVTGLVIYFSVALVVLRGTLL
ncbi:MAG TPA: magnesium transporter [Vicinamibacterales bacterium]|jgi:magnesium transporter